jgi:hypothetical protein
MERFIAINGIHGDTIVYLDSATNLKEAKESVALLEASEPWCIKTTETKE